MNDPMSQCRKNERSDISVSGKWTVWYISVGRMNGPISQCLKNERSYILVSEEWTVRYLSVGRMNGPISQCWENGRDDERNRLATFLKLFFEHALARSRSRPISQPDFTNLQPEQSDCACMYVYIMIIPVFLKRDRFNMTAVENY